MKDNHCFCIRNSSQLRLYRRTITIYSKSDYPGFESRCLRVFPYSSRSAPRLTQPPVEGVPAVFPRGKAPGSWRSPPNPFWRRGWVCVELYLCIHSVSWWRDSLLRVVKQSYKTYVTVSIGRIARAEPDGTRTETRFRLSPKRTSPFKSVGASVQSTAGSRGVRISLSNAG